MKTYKPKKIAFSLNANDLSLWYGQDSTLYPTKYEELDKSMRKYGNLLAKQIRNKFPKVPVTFDIVYNNTLGNNSIVAFVYGKDSEENEKIADYVWELNQDLYASGNFF